MSKNEVVPVARIENIILVIRGQKVILDRDLAQLYNVTTKRLNEQVRRNHSRFPDDFIFRLTAKEKAKVVANCDHLSTLKFSPSLPYVFTEHGAIMAACALNAKERFLRQDIQDKRNFFGTFSFIRSRNTQGTSVLKFY